MRLNQGADLWWKQHLKEAREFLNSSINLEIEKKFFLDQKIARYKHRFEIIQLKVENPGFTLLLSQLSLEGRLFYLRDANHTGLSQVEMELILKLDTKKLSRYLQKKNQRYELEVIEYIAVVLKVPTHWITRDKITYTWENQFLLNLIDAEYTVERLQTYLNKIKKVNRDVKGIRLHINQYLYCIRLEVLNGSVFIEILYHDAKERWFTVLDNTFPQLNLQIGYFRTLIPNRQHPGAYSSYRAIKIICMPVEFYTDTAVTAVDPYEGK